MITFIVFSEIVRAGWCLPSNWGEIATWECIFITRKEQPFNCNRWHHRIFICFSSKHNFSRIWFKKIYLFVSFLHLPKLDICSMKYVWQILSFFNKYIYMVCFRTRQNFNWNKSVFRFQFWYYIFCPICLIDLISNVSENRMQRKFIQIVKYAWWRGYFLGLLA